MARFERNELKMGNTTLSINPGSGTVYDSREATAIDNMYVFCREIGPDIEFLRAKKADDMGRFGFRVHRKGMGGKCPVIQMPGIPLEEVRFISAPGQDVWQFPRLYVDYSSWLWMFAVDIVREHFGFGCIYKTN